MISNIGPGGPRVVSLHISKQNKGKKLFPLPSPLFNPVSLGSNGGSTTNTAKATHRTWRRHIDAQPFKRDGNQVCFLCSSSFLLLLYCYSASFLFFFFSMSLFLFLSFLFVCSSLFFFLDKFWKPLWFLPVGKGWVFWASW